jgi:hypothetical protein
MVTGLPSLATFDWAALGAEASLMFKAAPGINCMLGPLSAEVSGLHTQAARLIVAYCFLCYQGCLPG